MIAFILSMPNVGSWNHRWSGEGRIYCRIRTDRSVPKDVVGKYYRYDFGDGWCAGIEVKHVDNAEARKLNRQSQGFYGYEWMITSIIKHGYIITEEKYIEENGNEEQKYILNIAQYIGTSHHNADFTKISDFSINRKDLDKLMELGLVSETDTVCENGPTLGTIKTFMEKYDDELYTLSASAENKQITFKTISKNPFDKVHRAESADELDALVKDFTSVRLMFDNRTKEYQFA